MKVYNTLTRQKETLEPRVPGQVRIYTCGPTVYSYIHIGNARAAVAFDTLRRYLLAQDYDVRYVQNFTDIDDKMIRTAREEGITVSELADRFIAEYKKDAEGLNVLPPDVAPRATESIDAMLDLIGRLVDKGYAYAANGSVYFSVRSWPHYGKLSGYALEDLQNEVREGLYHEEGKRDPLDFVLWKGKKPGEPSWESPWGEGRPGWHIECSAMVHKYLEDVIDIHAGGLDLIFPHHENEIAQSEAATGKPFATYWLHNGFVNVDHVKMSKSKGNFKTARQIAERYSYMTMRYLLISAHYRSPMNFSQDILEAAHVAYQRIQTAVNRLRFLIGEHDAAAHETLPADTTADELTTAATEAVQETLTDTLDHFRRAMDDDLNTPDALGAVFELVRYANKVLDAEASAYDDADALDRDRVAVLEHLLFMTGILGLAFPDAEDDIPAEVHAWVEARSEAKAAKDYAEADALRDKILEAGYIVRDTPQGPQLERAHD